MMNLDESTVAPVSNKHVIHPKPKTIFPALLLGASLAVRVALLLIATVFATSSGGAQDLSNLSSGNQVWRCSFDGKFYEITNWNGVHIRAINSGQVVAEVNALTDKKGRIKTDKKGNSKLEGRWGSTTYGGLIVIQNVEPSTIRGFLLEPAPGIQASMCNSRKAAIMLSIGQPAAICNVLNVSWDLQPGVSAEQASAAEAIQDSGPRNISFAQRSSSNNNADQRLVGTWFKEVFDGNARYTTTLVLRGDGTYSKSLIGVAHSGTWTSSGTSVHLSGDGHYPPADEKLSLFRKVN